MAKTSKTSQHRPQEGGRKGARSRTEGRGQKPAAPKAGRTWRVSTCRFPTPSTSG